MASTPQRRDVHSYSMHDGSHEHYVENEYGSGSTSYPTHYDESGDIRRFNRESGDPIANVAHPEEPERSYSARYSGGAAEVCSRTESRREGAAPTDSWIWEKVCLALTADPYIDASGIIVVVENGIVELRGNVRNAATRERIMSILSAQWCVRGIEDNLSYRR